MDPVHLARIQFGFTISFHIIFPAFTIGLAAYIATLLAMWVRSGQERYQLLAPFSTHTFAVSFGISVGSGIVSSYLFRTNWGRLSVVTGNVIGPAVGFEVLMAFFLEATFLGVLLFGWKRVPPWLLTFSAAVVAVGTAISAFWILSANSWMQTPAGHVVRGGIAYPLDWLAIIFNPSFPYRLAHMLTAAYLTTAFVVLAVGARYLVGERHEADGRTMVRMAVGMIAVMAPLQLFFGDQHGLNTLKYQPIKVAAMEAHWDGSKPGDFHVFAWPDEKNETNRFAISIPRGSSLILTHDPNGLFPGLKSVPRDQRPPIVPVFFAFRIMIGIGFLMIAIGLYGALLWWRGQLVTTRWYLQIVQHGWWLGFVAVLCGWITTEVGRQPWIAYGILRTADAISPVSAASVLTTLVLFVVVYGIVFTMGLYYINRLIVRGPQGSAIEPSGHDTPNRPLAAAHDAAREAMQPGA